MGFFNDTTSMIAIIDYGMGNLRSVQKAVQLVEADTHIVRTPEEVLAADKLILPGVGAFCDAIAHLRDAHLDDPIRQFIASGKPFLGICLGLQLLFEVSEEDGEHTGLGILPGRVVRFNPTDHALKVPHMGWNGLRFTQNDSPLLRGLDDGCHVYFVHSYYACPSDEHITAAVTDYDGEFCASICCDNIMATQFHPEKSQQVGLKMLENFARL